MAHPTHPCHPSQLTAPPALSWEPFIQELPEPHGHPTGQDGETEAQRGSVTPPRPHSWNAWSLGLTSDSPESVHTLSQNPIPVFGACRLSVGPGPPQGHPAGEGGQGPHPIVGPTMGGRRVSVCLDGGLPVSGQPVRAQEGLLSQRKRGRRLAALPSSIVPHCQSWGIPEFSQELREEDDSGHYRWREGPGNISRLTFSHFTDENNRPSDSQVITQGGRFQVGLCLRPSQGCPGVSYQPQWSQGPHCTRWWAETASQEVCGMLAPPRVTGHTYRQEAPQN